MWGSGETYVLTCHFLCICLQNSNKDFPFYILKTLSLILLDLADIHSTFLWVQSCQMFFGLSPSNFCCLHLGCCAKQLQIVLGCFLLRGLKLATLLNSSILALAFYTIHEVFRSHFKSLDMMVPSNFALSITSIVSSLIFNLVVNWKLSVKLKIMFLSSCNLSSFSGCLSIHQFCSTILETASSGVEWTCCGMGCHLELGSLSWIM